MKKPTSITLRSTFTVNQKEHHEIHTGYVEDEDSDMYEQYECESCYDVIPSGEKYWGFWPEECGHTHYAYYICQSCYEKATINYA
jgi:hypothetical protein